MPQIDQEKQDFLIRLGSYLRALREEEGISLSDMSRKLLMDTGNYSRIETGKTNPTAYTLKKFAEALNMEISDLLKNFN